MSEASIRVDFRKWPDDPHWHFAVRELGHDGHGRWFWLPRGALLQRGDEDPVVHPCTAALLIADGAWWVAFWNSDPGQPFELYVDVIEPATWAGDRVRMVDLDLDVARSWTGDVELLDRDEFDDHRHARSYPPHLVKGAELAAEELLERVRARDEPFGAVGADWLDAALARAPA